MRYTVERETPADRATASTLIRCAGALRSRSITASMIRRCVSAAESARAFCSYARATLCGTLSLSLDSSSRECQTDRTHKTCCPIKAENGMTAQEVDVLVVGAGPAGLTAAATLASYGVLVQVVERKQKLSRHPRATVVSTRSMELLRRWGLEDEIKAGGMPRVEWLALATDTLADAD